MMQRFEVEFSNQGATCGDQVPVIVAATDEQAATKTVLRMLDLNFIRPEFEWDNWTIKRVH